MIAGHLTWNSILTSAMPPASLTWPITEVNHEDHPGN